MSAADTLRKCAVCQDTGCKTNEGYLDCSAPGCDAVDKRIALNGFMKSLDWNLTDADRAWAVFQYAQKQFQAEAVLRDGEKQEPVGWMADTPHGKIFSDEKAQPGTPRYYWDWVPLYTHPEPSLQAVGAAPEGLTYEADDGTISAHQDGEMLWHAHIYANMEEVDMVETAKQVAAKLAAPQPVAAPEKNGLASFYLAEDGLTCTHEVGDCKLPIWCKDSPDAYNALRIISRLYIRENRPAAAPSGDVDLSKLTRFGWTEAYIGESSELVEDANGPYVKFADVIAAITATKE